MVAHLITLKLLLVRNGLRRSPWQLVGIVLGALYLLLRPIRRDLARVTATANTIATEDLALLAQNARAIAACVAARPNGITSTGSGKRPSTSTSLLSSTINTQ